jgi:hypothetical protein
MWFIRNKDRAGGGKLGTKGAPWRKHHCLVWPALSDPAHYTSWLSPSVFQLWQTGSVGTLKSAWGKGSFWNKCLAFEEGDFEKILIWMPMFWEFHFIYLHLFLGS